MPTQRLRVLFARGGALLGCLLAACGGGGGGEPLLVFGAASLADALEASGAAWEARHPDESVSFNLAGSNDLARQIAAGAPADLFVSADRERLVAAERADLEGAVALLANRLVVVAPAGSAGDGVSVSGARDLLAFPRLGLADPEAVPAGVYARQWLEREGVWEELRQRVVPALDVRANLAAVASGSLPVGVVYATDAVTSDRVKVLYRVPPDRAPEIVYWAAPVDGAGAGRRAAAERFLDFLSGPEAAASFERLGFRHLPSSLPPHASEGRVLGGGSAAGTIMPPQEEFREGASPSSLRAPLREAEGSGKRIEGMGGGLVSLGGAGDEESKPSPAGAESTERGQ